MRPESRRRLDRFLLIVGAAVVGVVGLIGAVAGDTERIGAFWAHAHVDVNGDASVTEVIDYDFGSNLKHGLLRQIPDVDPTTPFVISSPSAPDQFTTAAWWLGTEIRVGDPLTTISNRHRYSLAYPYRGLRDPALGDTPHVSWNAVGDGWAVDVNNIEVHITADRELLNPACATGELGASGGCTVEVVAPGHIVVHHDKVKPGNFLTVVAEFGDPVSATQPQPPTGRAPDPGVGWQTPAILAGLIALGGATLMSPIIRRTGREIVWEGGSVDAAFGPDDPNAPTRRIDVAQLRDLTTIEFEPPRDLSAALGGVIHLESVHNDHKTAWLLESVIREEIILDPTERAPTIHRGPTQPNAAVGGVLDTMFGNRGMISLKSYDAEFSTGWNKLDTALGDWRKSSGLWDERGEHRRNRAIGFGIVGTLLGIAGVAVGAAMANRNGGAWYPVIALGAGIAGLSLAAMIRSWELRVRTAAGSGAWIRIESFRRFLHESEAEHVERAAEVGLLRQYTAWAVALGEVDRWENAARAAAAGGTAIDVNTLNFAITSHALSSAVRSASTAPSSSSSGGGGFSGGGGGGGGGGSW